MKKLWMVLLVLLLLGNQGVLVSAADGKPRLTDEADLLSDSEEAVLLRQLDEISERQQVDIVVVTLNSLEGMSPRDYADDFYDYHGYGFGEKKDGILFLISMEERDWYISTTGYGITAVTDAGREYMSKQFVDDLKEGDYAEAFTVFAGLCDSFISRAREGKPYDVASLPKEPFGAAVNLAITFGAAFLISLIATGVMRGKLKTVRSQSGANNYMKHGSMRLTKKNDLFLYRQVSRRKKPKENVSKSSGSLGGSRTHKSSSGSTHGGGGGKF